MVLLECCGVELSPKCIGRDNEPRGAEAKVGRTLRRSSSLATVCEWCELSEFRGFLARAGGQSAAQGR